MKDKILVTQSSMPELEEYMQEIKSIFEIKHLTNMGPKHNELQEKLIEYLKVNNVSLFTNGHLALYTAIAALGLKGEVITTPFTFASTTHAIVQNGLKPVFCDINPKDYTMDVSKIEELITDKTCAIVPVHVYGNICDVEEIERIAKKHNLKVIYDAAHAFGVEYKNIGIGNYGDISMFSFHATKVFNTIEGGGLTYKDEGLTEKLSMLRNFGMTGPETIEAPGMNCKMNEFQAAMGICNLRHIDGEIEKRKHVVERYKKNLSNIEGITLCEEQKDVKSNYAYFPVVFDKNKFGKSRDEVMEELKNNNIFARKYFYPIMTEFDCYNKEYDSNKTPIAKEISENVLTLPLYADLKLEQVDEICKVILK